MLKTLVVVSLVCFVGKLSFGKIERSSRNFLPPHSLRVASSCTMIQQQNTDWGAGGSEYETIYLVPSSDSCCGSCQSDSNCDGWVYDMVSGLARARLEEMVLDSHDVWQRPGRTQRCYLKHSQTVGFTSNVPGLTSGAKGVVTCLLRAHIL